MSRKSIACIVLALGLATTGPALACKGSTVLYQADFRSVDPSWDSNLAMGGGVAKIAPQPGYLSWPFYQGGLFTDADICVDITIPTDAKPDSVAGGLVFWAEDYGNFYTLLVANGGTMAILRRQGGKFLSPVGWRKVEAVDLTPNAPNTLRVMLKGKSVATFINDKPFVGLPNGQPPDGGSQIGLYASSESDKSNTWTFSNLKVTNVP